MPNYVETFDVKGVVTQVRDKDAHTEIDSLKKTVSENTTDITQLETKIEQISAGETYDISYDSTGKKITITTK